MSTKNRVIEVPGYAISVQSCDKQIARVAVFDLAAGKMATHHIALPSLEREPKHSYSWDLAPSEYDRVLQENKDALLARIKQLNTKGG